MKKALQLNLNISPLKTTKHQQSVQINPWVTTAINAQRRPKNSHQQGPSQMLEVNMTFCKSILSRR